MIGKLALAGALLISGIGLIAPLAIAVGGSDLCVATPTEPPPEDCEPPTGVDTGGDTGGDAGGDTGGLPGSAEAVGRAHRLVGGHGYYQLCARLAANIWGRPRSGYYSAAEQWRQMAATGKAHLHDRQFPVGALLFWSTGGPFGHVAVYIGNGRIVSNDINDRFPGEGGVYDVEFGLIESRWGATYLGWAPPIY
ncbi:NlpC/P60 family protein [Kribbella sp. CA-293567]|uniref:NlpC/P60 family protein n=1 Tax=Kribbella sp. CA-293567 TaxID=3002436 RepID=UPI0022DE3E94|nr:NlpC/P60 family protein [Kribbella sp. CA-293567]WBQ04406.1 NlpC/P60 family protein [Kribbella sp. CA-293567]